MSYSMEGKLVIGISSGALFERSAEEELFCAEGAEAYCRYQRAHEDELLKPGCGFELIKGLLDLNGPGRGEKEAERCEGERTERGAEERNVEVILMSRNSPDLSLRIYRSIEHYGLDISRSVFVGGAPLEPYFRAFHLDLFLSSNEEDVCEAIRRGVAAGVVRKAGQAGTQERGPGRGEVRIALDADAVIFGDESEAVFQDKGLAAFERHEKSLARIPLSRGPFAGLLGKLNSLQRKLEVQAPAAEGESSGPPRIRIAVVTARSAPAHERVIRTLRDWGMCVDEAFFLGGMSKKEAVGAFAPLIYFDDQRIHTDEVALVAPTARVPGMVTDRRSKGEIYEIQQYRSGVFYGKAQPVYCTGGAGG